MLFGFAGNERAIRAYRRRVSRDRPAAGGASLCGRGGGHCPYGLSCPGVFETTAVKRRMGGSPPDCRTALDSASWPEVLSGRNFAGHVVRIGATVRRALHDAVQPQRTASP